MGAAGVGTGGGAGGEGSGLAHLMPLRKSAMSVSYFCPMTKCGSIWWMRKVMMSRNCLLVGRVRILGEMALL